MSRYEKIIYKEEDIINYCKSRKAKGKYYFNEKNKDNILNSKWQLRVPKAILAGGEEQYW